VDCCAQALSTFACSSKRFPSRSSARKVTVIAIEQADGTQGYSPEQSDGFHVEVVNQLKVPTSIHWHGLVLPNLMDGVPYVTQPPIPPGGSFRYDFPLKQSGTYWTHSHYGLQEQLFNSAPMIIWTREEWAKADRQLVVMFSDFSFTPPGKILKDLKGGMQMPGMAEEASGKMEMADAKENGAHGCLPARRGHCSAVGRSEAGPEACRGAKTRGGS
jgi:FtsP/CotA-like multicopper oxidase with cupredoxin domain